MGFNFVACETVEMLGEEFADEFVHHIRSRVSPDVPMGQPGIYFCIEDEVAWSWWSKLQGLARERLDECPNILAVDAWEGVYLDMAPERLLFWPDGESPEQGSDDFKRGRPEEIGAPLWRRLLRGLKLMKEPQTSDEVAAVLQDMLEAYGTRRGERGAVQIGNLPGLFRELSDLLRLLEVNADRNAVEAVRVEYRSDDRCDDDPEIQCLCHAWLTADFAIRNGCPLWLIK
jgi:hypothetical protein